MPHHIFAYDRVLHPKHGAGTVVAFTDHGPHAAVTATVRLDIAHGPTSHLELPVSSLTRVGS